jgi:hypothetical protein
MQTASVRAGQNLAAQTAVVSVRLKVQVVHVADVMIELL